MSNRHGIQGVYQEVYGTDRHQEGLGRQTSGALAQVSRSTWTSGVYKRPAACSVCADVAAV